MSLLLEIDDLRVEGRPPGGRYAPIVKGVSLGVKRGEVLALIGESGSGKTTVALATLGYTRPGCRIAGGKVSLGDADVLSLDSGGRRRLRGRSVAYVAQSAAAAFNPAITIGAQVTESAKIHRLMTPAAAKQEAIELYRRLDLPEPNVIGRRYPHQVSGGQLQRLMAAMAMNSKPDLLILDEPTTALDVTTQIEVLSAFKDLIKQQNTAVIYVTHDLAVVAQIADHIIVLYGGEVMERGSTHQILHEPKHTYTRTLMAAVRLPRRGTHERIDEVQSGTGDSVLEVSGITAGYANTPVLQNIDMVVTRAQTIGVIGESGCGKSTLARVIAGLTPLWSGTLLHQGENLPSRARNRNKDDLRRIQIVFQMPDVAVNPRHRVRDIIGRPLDFFLALEVEKKRSRIGELLEMVELPRSFESRYPGELSGGQKQRVNLARALAAEPELILCDEVTSSLDTVVGAAVISLLERLQKELAVSYIFISHDLSTVASFADQVMVLYAGRVVEQGRTEDVLSPPFHPYTRLLLSSVPEMRQGWLEDVMSSRSAVAGLERSVELGASGCPFSKRCPVAVNSLCDVQDAPLIALPAGHRIACHRDAAELSV